MAESFELTKDGTARAILGDGTTYVLRRPRVGELKKLREMHNSIVEDSKRRYRDALSAYKAQGWEDEEAATLASTDSDVTEDVFKWVIEAFRMLCETDLVETDDLPPWFENGGLPARMMNHWRTVPFVSGM